MIAAMAQSPKDKPPEEPPPRRNRSEPVSFAANSVGGAALARAGFSDLTLILRWEEIVGHEIARIARPVRLAQGAVGGVLTLLSEPGASVFLQHESRALCERINTYLGRKAVAKLRFVQGNLRAPRPLPLHPQLPAHVSENDPVGQFQGSERLRSALLSLSRARAVRFRPASN